MLYPEFRGYPSIPEPRIWDFSVALGPRYCIRIPMKLASGWAAECWVLELASSVACRRLENAPKNVLSWASILVSEAVRFPYSIHGDITQENLNQSCIIMADPPPFFL
ncbi:unnamed protein product [Tuber melanosporum]|uniref:(Perigord truffle) hypothetical protein n=1 Tax=Tuber melanosporum (strain Mel28) TaxID=656061 RepID=D5G847_TUBMM|nr:uncharacterized protein GSTUM_00002811001 [Tuber melanosporum]CAZ80690.1 unnamed protein product [Tuber melanosporum]